MSQLLLLLKVDIIRTISLNKLMGNKSKLKIIGTILLGLFLLSSLLVTMGSYTYLGTKFFMNYGLEKYIMPIIYFVCAFTIFYSTIYRAKSYLFNSEDNIFSMPIKPSTILASRVITLIILSFIPITLVFIPSVITYGVMLKLGVTFYINAIIGYLFMPLLPTILGGIFGYLIGYIASKFGNNKIFETVLTYSAVLLIMFLSFNIQTVAMKFINNVEVINNILNNVGFLINSFMNMLTENSIKDLLIYVSTNILVVLAFIAIFSKSYVKIVQNLKVEKAKSKYIEKDHKTKGVIATLLLKEIKMYLSIPIYILNTSFGGVLIFFASIATLFYDKNSLYKMMEIEPSALPIYVLLLAGVAFMVAMSNTAACSISIEGKNFWILKTMPIKVKDIFISKFILNILVVSPLSILSIILLGISFELTLLQILTVCLLALVINVVCSMFGLIVNLKYPRLDFPSYQYVVKQSFSTFLAVMVPLAVFFGFVILYSVLKMPIDTYILIAFALLLAIIMIEYYILKKWGIKRFNEIN